MKRIKIMLVAIVLFAVVGGALAFKAKSTLDWCTALTIDVNECPDVCPDPLLNQKKDASGVQYCYTPTVAPDLCDDNQPVCEGISSFIID